MAGRLDRAVRVVFAVVAAGLILLPGSAVAQEPIEEPAGCGGDWIGADPVSAATQATCEFDYEGGGLWVEGGGHSTGPIGHLTVTIEVVDQTGQRVPIVVCTTGAGPGFGACGTASSGSMTVDVDEGARLFCVVRGSGAGHYKCENIEFPPL